MDLTIVITTSPIKSNPSTDLLERVFKSFKKVNHLTDCPKIIVCDGYKIGDVHKYKSGVITGESAAKYQEYIAKLKSLILKNTFSNTELIVRNKRCGFASNIEFSLDHVKTKYIFVYQHDWTIEKPVDISKIIQIMNKHDDVKYVGFMTSLTAKFIDQMDNSWRKQIEKNTGKDIKQYYDQHFGMPLIPLNFWYDRPHICSVRFYKDFVFGQKHYDYVRNDSFKVSNFIEDSFGQIEKNDIKTNGLIGHARYGTYLLYENDEPVLYHEDGRRII